MAWVPIDDYRSVYFLDFGDDNVNISSLLTDDLDLVFVKQLGLVNSDTPAYHIDCSVPGGEETPYQIAWAKALDNRSSQSKWNGKCLD